MALDEDESVRIAVRALGDMKNGGFASTSTSVQPTPALSVTSGTSSPSLPSPVYEGEDRILGSIAADSEDRLELRPDDADFVSRMSSLPIVNTALRAYEQSKASSRVVKYGAEMMESSVKSISRPVIDRLPVGQIDDFACRQLDRYATGHIDAQILVLRNFVTSLQTTSPSAAAAAISAQHLRTLNAAKRDVIDTIRQVVDIVSKYAGGALPEPARTRVRTFILRLPRRWAEASGADAHHHGHGSDGRPNGGADRVDMRRSANVAPYSYGPGEAGPSPRSRPPSRATSPGHTRAHSRQASAQTGAPSGMAPTTVDSANQAAQRIMTLATESLDMLRGVTAVVSESLERADAWVERLRVVGLQRQNGEAGPDASLDALPDIDAVLDPQLRAETLHTHRQLYSHSPSSPLSPYAPLSPMSASGRSTPAYVPSRNNSSSALSMGPPGSLSSYYSATSLDAGGAAASLNALSLTSQSAASSRYATPKHSHSALPSEGDGDSPVYMSRNRAGKRPVDSNGDDPTVVAATALAGLAGSAKRVKQEPGKDERMDVDP
ncbi:hypothetical protein EVJ58_g4733 [Rhodofomes roseus]|uniref:Opi1-domain-containing protein n=1 Tax=Rhodofomes roseus TaxID=34475 RepID=A0A4Y9YFE1_9APHY|nr:hypothetical protein EVJ58_g4733 [Rhodofomes roseus]